jgi:hypothetical protein
MKRSRLVTPVMVFTIALLAVAAAAYAPHNARLRGLAQENAMYVPCSSTLVIPTTASSSKADAVKERPTQQASSKPLYPVPSEDVIARGHSGQAN